ncbi:MAG: alkaline phosphatase D family protein [Pseudomonadota bacterium]
MNTQSGGSYRHPSAVLALLLLPLPAIVDAAGGFAWFSCEDHPRPLTIASAIIDLDPDLVISQGDAPYTNHATTAWGISAEPVQFDSVAAGPNPQDFNHHYEQMMLTPGWPALAAAPFDLYVQFDDHEWGGDNWAHNLYTANLQVPINATTQAQVNYHWRQGRAAWQTWADAWSDNAQATYDISENTIVPSGALAENETPSPSDYPISYFRKTYGDIEFIFIDDISYRDYSDATLRNTPVSLLGAQQKAWLIDRINASTAKFVVVSSTKTLGASGPGDSWRYYPMERDAILAALTRTGVLWISGDYHYPSVIRQKDGAASRWSNVNPGPAGVVWSGHGPADDNTGTLVWAAVPDPDGNGQTRTDMFGYGYLLNDRLHVEIRSADQTVYYHGYLTMDSNELTTVSGLPSLPLANDDDTDGVPNDSDNCRSVPNGPFLQDPGDGGMAQRNTDGDPEGDACDLDDDNDGLTDSYELQIGTERLLFDTDNDGAGDGAEVTAGTDPLDDTSYPGMLVPGDINVDGVVDVQDLLLATNILAGSYSPSPAEQARWDIAPLVAGYPQPDGNNDGGDLLVLMRIVTGAVYLAHW